MNKEEFSQLLVSHREATNCGKNEMCRKMGVMFHHLQRIESATHNYLIDQVFDYLSAIGRTMILSSDEPKSSFKIKNRDDFRKAFKEMRKLNKLSQAKAAAKIGVIPGVITGIETRDVNTSIDKFIQCVYGLGYKITIK